MIKGLTALFICYNVTTNSKQMVKIMNIGDGKDRFSASMKVQTIEGIKQEAEKENRNFSNMAETLIKEALEARKKKAA